MSTDAVHTENVLVLDFGSQYTQLIARRIREFDVYSEILPYNATIEEIKSYAPKGIVLSGGPSSVYEMSGISILVSVYCIRIGNKYRCLAKCSKFGYGSCPCPADNKISPSVR